MFVLANGEFNYLFDEYHKCDFPYLQQGIRLVTYLRIAQAEMHANSHSLDPLDGIVKVHVSGG